MPELPEVEAARALIEERALGRRIAAVDDADTYVCRPHAPGEVAGALVGRTLTAARRIGKSMWCETDGGVRLGLHLGMAGRILIDGASAGDPVLPGEKASGHSDPRAEAHPSGRASRWTSRTAAISCCSTSAGSAAPSSTRTSTASDRMRRRSARSPSASASAVAPGR